MLSLAPALFTILQFGEGCFSCSSTHPHTCHHTCISGSCPDALFFCCVCLGGSPGCPGGCLTCSGSNGCLTCQPKLFFHLVRDNMRQIGVCLASCPKGYFGSRGPEKNDCLSKNHNHSLILMLEKLSLVNPITVRIIFHSLHLFIITYLV